ncbi:hypothetical protein FRB99_003100 [Tulasnella sp. 403]|nr:hypothetical protein FRB99_003100 [Tulasnella sp. 403]
MPKKKPLTAAQAKQKAAKKAKTDKKTEKREGKKKKVEGGEEDLDAILDQLAKEWEEKHKVNEELASGPPSKRANATLTPCPSGDHLWFIGGEYFAEDGKAHFYKDVFRYAPDKDEWRSYVSPNSPGPRSAHSVVASPIGGGKLFLFGGEFSSLNQNTFHHYRDLWVFDVNTHAWERIETKTKPSARSGHRMALWKHFIVLFGGFVDLGLRTSYLNDLWLFDIQEYKWQQIEFGPHEKVPSPRSGFSFLSVPEGIVLCGKHWVDTLGDCLRANNTKGGYMKNYAKGKEAVGVSLDDVWLLKMSQDTKEIKWENRKKIGYAPNPPRSGCTMTLWQAKAQGVMFGGVSDVDKGEEELESVFYNDMCVNSSDGMKDLMTLWDVWDVRYAYQTAGNGRWVSLNLRKRKKPGGSRKPAPAPTNDADAMDVDDIDTPVDGDDGVSPIKQPTPLNSPLGQGVDTSAALPMSRYNTMLAILRNTLYIYGGMYERGSREYTFDDFWSIQLDKMDAFTCLRPLDVEFGEDEGSSSEDDDDEAGDESESIDDGNDEVDDEEMDTEEPAGPSISPVNSHLRAEASAFLNLSKDATRTAEEQLSMPLPGETLAVFYARSKDYWAQKAHEYSDNRGKLLRRDGFGLAEERYGTYKPLLEEVEKILAESGLDEEEIKRAGTGTGLQSGGRSRR